MRDVYTYIQFVHNLLHEIIPKRIFPMSGGTNLMYKQMAQKKSSIFRLSLFSRCFSFFVTFYVQHLVYWTYFSLIHFEFTFYRIAYETCAFYELAQHNIICCIIWRLPKNYFINCMWLIPPLPSTYGKHLEKMQFNWTNECWEKSIGKPYVYRIRTWMKCTI